MLCDTNLNNSYRLEKLPTQNHKSETVLVITQVSKIYRKSEKYKPFQKQIWLGAIHLNETIGAKTENLSVEYS